MSNALRNIRRNIREANGRERGTNPIAKNSRGKVKGTARHMDPMVVRMRKAAQPVEPESRIVVPESRIIIPGK